MKFLEFLRPLGRDLPRILIICIIASGMLYLSDDVARWFNTPAFAPWLTFSAGAVYAVALSHLLRRLLFWRIDLQLIAGEAIKNPVGAGLVFLGMCMVLSAFVLMTGAMFRV